MILYYNLLRISEDALEMFDGASFDSDANVILS